MRVSTKSADQAGLHIPKLFLAAVPVTYGVPGVPRRRILERQAVPQDQLDVALAEPMHSDARNPCDALLHIPKVALLFMTSGKMPHERLWRLWVKQAKALVPLDAVRRYAATSSRPGAPLDPARLQQLAQACAARQTAAGELPVSQLDRQFLFTFYIHAAPDVPGFNASSMFAGSLIPHRTHARRQEHSLIDAERLLLAEALRDPLNQRFLLLSDTTLPLYGPALVYQQAMAETLSRMDACTYHPEIPGNLDRWDAGMEGPHFKMHHWRKTSMWFSMPRKHAEVIAREVEINAAFQQFCKKRLVHPLTNSTASCSSCEHYPAIVMAVLGLEHETTCNGDGNTYVDWNIDIKYGHPRTFKNKDVNDSLVAVARTGYYCTLQETEEAIRSASQQFVNARSLPSPANPAAAALPADPPPPYPALGANCSLFIRKMPAFVERTAYRVLGRHVRGLPWEASVEEGEEGQKLVKYMKSRTVINSLLEAATSGLQAL
ncbi:hypothetical protein N2152v2_007370 [Parachlorella kessleri]